MVTQAAPAWSDIPAPGVQQVHLRHVIPSALGALGMAQHPNLLGIPSCSVAVVLLVDGLGDQHLAAYSGHARYLARAWRRAETAGVIDTGMPTTTSASLTSLGTGTSSGQHGLVGYDVYHPELDRVVNMLGRWDPEVDPADWQSQPHLFTQAGRYGVSVLTASRAGFRDSSLTRAALTGGDFIGATRIEDRCARTLEWITEQRAAAGGVRRGPAPKNLVYLYVDELDKTGHQYGVGSPQWIAMLESLDASAERFCTTLQRTLGDQASVVLTADHGMVNVAETNRIDLAEHPELFTGVRHCAGEPRFLHLHTEPEAGESVLRRWESAFGDRAVMATRAQAVSAGWFGEVADHIVPRIGDVLVAAWDEVAFFDTARTGSGPLSMVGQHGSLTAAERIVPKLELTGRPFTGS